LHPLQRGPGAYREGLRVAAGDLAALAIASVAAAGCAAPLADDGSSISLGTYAEGALRRGVALPPDGDGYTVARPWRGRRSHFGTEEMVAWLVRSTRQVSRRLPGGIAAVGDLSRLGGGASVEHKSHQSGRDVDIFFYAMDAAGKPVRPGNSMIRYDAVGRAARWSPADGWAPPAEPLPAHRFDVRRNWALVKAMLLDPEAEVQWIFIHRALAGLMLQAAAASGEDQGIVARAAALMHQPTDAEAHDDHMHVRLYCDATDRILGCADRGPQRWWKKRWKHMSRGLAGERSPYGDVLDAFMRLFGRRIPVAPNPVSA